MKMEMPGFHNAFTHSLGPGEGVRASAKAVPKSLLYYRNQGRRKQMVRWDNDMSLLKELQAHPSDVHAQS